VDTGSVSARHRPGQNNLILIEGLRHTPLGAAGMAGKSGNFGACGFSTQTYKHLNSGEAWFAHLR